MPRNSSGTYTLPSSVNPVVSGTPITTSWANTTLDDVQQALTDSLDRQGRGGMLAPFKFFDGSVAAPGASFTNETSSGFSRVGAGIIGVSSLATKVAEFGPAGLRTADGAQATPSLTFVSDTDTGFFKQATDTIGVTMGGTERLRMATTGFILVHADTQFLGLNADTVTDPSYSWVSDADTGMYHPAADTVGFTTAGTAAWFINDAQALASHAAPPSFGSLGKINIAGTTTGAQSSVIISRFSNDTFGPYIRFGKSQSGTVGTFTAVAAVGTELGGVGFYGADGTDGGTISARIRAVAGEVFSGTNHGGNLEFACRNNGAGGAFTTRLTLDDNGATLAGSLVASGANNRLGGSVLTAPVLALRDGTATGQTANTGVDALVIDSTGSSGITLLGGNTATHQIRFGDTDNNAIGGFVYAHSSDTMNIVAGATTGISVSPTDVTMGVETILAVVTPTSVASAGFRGLPTIGNVATAAKSGVGRVYLNTGNIACNNSVFAAGDVFCVYNNSAAAITLTQGAGVTMRLGGTATTGSRTLAARGFATVFWPTASECVITGAGVT